MKLEKVLDYLQRNRDVYKEYMDFDINKSIQKFNEESSLIQNKIRK